MKKIILFFILVSNILSVSAQDVLNIMTFNIRLNVSSDSLNAWPYRRDLVASQILFQQAHIVGVQEALHDQMQDLQQRLPGYGFIGVGREDGKENGEYSALFYDTSRLTVMRSETFWLSKTPRVPGSKDWDAAITRIVTWGKFHDKNTGKDFFVFNTHFDHIGTRARAESAKIILHAVDSLAEDLPVIVTGDFNAKPLDQPIRIIIDPSDPLHLTDTKSVSVTPHYGPSGTFNGFQSHEIDDQPIDHIFIKKGIKVWQHATLSESWQGRFSSDHFPVFVKLEIL
jgi:endonuclease/exonuclease/phosphatase family metal-dependent hydrolase